MKKLFLPVQPGVVCLLSGLLITISASAQNVGIGTSTPLSLLHVSEGNFLVTGTFQGGNAIEINGAGTRMFFNAMKAALRAGYVDGPQWDDANIGEHSIGFGINALAKTFASLSIGEANIAETSPFAMAIGRQNHSTGYASLAMGHFSEATGDYSASIGLRDTVGGYAATAVGSYNKVPGHYSFAAGVENTVISDASSALGIQNKLTGYGSIASGRYNYTAGNHSTAFGYADSSAADQAFTTGWGNTVKGNNSSALGTFNYAPSYGEVTIGNYASQYSPASSNALNATDRVFTVGIGTTNENRADAMVIKKNGRVGIGTAEPLANLHLHGQSGYTILRISNTVSTSGSAILFRSDNPGAEAQVGINGSTHPLLPNALFLYQAGNHPIKMTTGGIDRMIITGSGNIGIGTNMPAAKLDVAGTVKIADGTQGAGKVLTSDANGVASWQASSGTKAYFHSWLYGAPPFILTSGVETPANFSISRYNTNISYSGGTITVLSDGLYHFDIMGEVVNTYSNIHAIQIRTYVNGGLSEQAFCSTLSKDLLLSANDQVVFKFLQNTGVDVTLSPFSRISCHKVD